MMIAPLAETQLQPLLDELTTGTRRLVIWGAGSLLEIVLPALPRRPAYLVDGNPEHWGREIHGLAVMPPPHLATENSDEVLILIASSYTDQILPEIRRHGAFTCLPLHRHDVLADLFDRLLARSPDAIEGWLGRGLAHMIPETHTGFAEAARCFEQVVARTPDDAGPWFRLGNAWVGTGDPERAADAFRRVVALDPGHAAAHLRLSECLSYGAADTEAIEYHLQRAVALDPKVSPTAAAELAEWAPPAGRKRTPAIARYPKLARLQGDIKSCIRDDVLGIFGPDDRFLTPATRFFTMGSCFASNIARSLQGLGIHADNVPVGEAVNSTYANRYLLDWVLGRSVPADIAERIEELVGEFSSRDALRDMLGTADAFIYTVGVAPAFFDSATGQFVMPRSSFINSRSLASRFQFRTTTVAENRDNLAHLVAALRTINPGLRIFLTVSPVPLQVTFEQKSAVLADCLSKSTLRVAVEEVLALGLERLHYWPSFEMVRWIGGHLPTVYGVDDGNAHHISLSYIDMIMELFVETLSFGATATR